jgi:hypothetical protein
VFTGFDANDDLCVHDLATGRPLHVIDSTLNAVRATYVGRHEIAAQSFTFTPLHVGSRSLGYRNASEYGSDGRRQGRGAVARHGARGVGCGGKPRDGHLLGIVIHFPPLDITRAGVGKTNPHAIIGEVRYSAVDGSDAPDGVALPTVAELCTVAEATLRPLPVAHQGLGGAVAANAVDVQRT